jgi:hypothetical protein
MKPPLIAALALIMPAILHAEKPWLLTPPELAALAAQAPAALQAPIQTVTDKHQASPSGDNHDYVSYARYYWPDPAKPDGLPYLSRDGHHNLAQVARGDHKRLWDFCGNVEILAAAWSLHHDDAAAARAVAWLRAWFITPATRMNPNLEFAQIALGHNHNHGRSYGVLDARCFAELIDALRLLHGSPALTPADETAIRRWFGDYLHWLTTAKPALAERAAANNHGSWYLAQAIPIARWAGRDDIARQLCEEDKTRIARQFQPDGSQPDEIRRVDGLGYSRFNLEAQFRVARLAAELGVDLWHYTAPNGASLRQGLACLIPYNAAPQTWPHSQHENLRPGFLDNLIAHGREVWPDLLTPSTPASP